MAYANARRAERLRAGLARGEGVTRAALDAGFNSSGRLHAHSAQVLGMTASRFRAGGAGAEIRFAVAQSSLGALLVAASKLGVCDIALGDDAGQLVQQFQARFSQAELVGDDAAFSSMLASVVAFVEAQHGLDLPLTSGHGVPAARWQLC